MQIYNYFSIYNLLKHNWPIILITTIITIITTIWFWDGRYLAGGEQGILFLSGTDLSSTWADSGIGYYRYDAARISRILIDSLNLVLPLTAIQYITLWSILNIGSISIYKLTSLTYTRYNKISILASLLAALFYIFNPFTMMVLRRLQPFLIFELALFPLLTFLSIKGIKNRDFNYAFFSALSTLSLGYALGHPSGILSMFGIILSILAFFLVTEKGRNNKLFILKYISLELFFIIILNSWWILEVLVTINTSPYGNTMERERSLSTFISISKNLYLFDVISLISRFYIYKESAWGDVYSNTLFIFIPYILPILSALAILMYNKREQNHLFIYFIAMMPLIIFLSKGGIEPFNNMMVELFKAFPILLSYRNPYEKFGVLLQLFYSPLIGISLASLYKTIRKNISKYALVILLPCVLINIFVWPIWTGHVFYTPFDDRRITIPSYHLELANYINNEYDDFRVLVLPLVNEGTRYNWNGDIYDGISNVFDKTLNKEVISRLSEYKRIDFIRNLNYLLDKPEFVEILKILNVKYIIIPNDIAENFRLPISIADAKKNLLNVLNIKKEGILLEFNNSQNWVLRAPSSNKIINATNDNSFIFSMSPEREGCNWMIPIYWFDSSINMEKPKILSFYLKAEKISPIIIHIFTGNSRASFVPRYEVPIMEQTSINGKFYNILIDVGKASRIVGEANATNVTGIGIRVEGSCTLILNDVKLFEANLQTIRREGITNFKDFGELSVYKVDNKYFLERIYSTDNFITINQDNFLDILKEIDTKKQVVFFNDIQLPNSTLRKENISFEKINPSKWLVKINGNNTDPFLLIFSEQYNPFWKVYPGNVNFIDTLTTKSINDEYHFQVNGYANAWYIDKPNSLITIYFYPQTLYLLGLLISFITIVVTLFVIVKHYKIVRL